MAKLDAATRNALPSKDFAEPKERKFPINDASHARNALSRASAKGPGVESAVRAKVKKKFPGIGGNKRGAPKYPAIAKDYLS